MAKEFITYWTETPIIGNGKHKIISQSLEKQQEEIAKLVDRIDCGEIFTEQDVAEHEWDVTEYV
jgi:hypothetical protein